MKNFVNVNTRKARRAISAMVASGMTVAAATAAFAQTATPADGLNNILDGVSMGTVQTSVETVGLVVVGIFLTFAGIAIAGKLINVAKK